MNKQQRVVFELLNMLIQHDEQKGAVLIGHKSFRDALLRGARGLKMGKLPNPFIDFAQRIIEELLFSGDPKWVERGQALAQEWREMGGEG